jgi:hypothetical protein
MTLKGSDMSNIESICNELQSIDKEVRERFGNLSAVQLNWRPAEDSWSVAQCLEHLVLTNKMFFRELDSMIERGRPNTFWENWSPLTGIFTKLYFWYIKNDRTKVKAPVKKIVPASDVAPDVVDRFTGTQSEFIEKLKAVGDEKASKSVLTSPFLKVVTYKFCDGILILGEHERRHIRQALRVMNTEGFPKA